MELARLELATSSLLYLPFMISTAREAFSQLNYSPRCGDDIATAACSPFTSYLL